MEMGLYPSAGRIAKALILSAMLTDELSIWIMRDEDCLSARIELRSRWVALGALLALHLQAQPDLLGSMFGAPQALEGLRKARAQGWWSEELVTGVMMAVVSVEDGPAEVEFRHLKSVLTDLLKDHAAIIGRWRPTADGALEGVVVRSFYAADGGYACAVQLREGRLIYAKWPERLATGLQVRAMHLGGADWALIVAGQRSIA